MITRMTGKNQITVPAEIVAKAELSPGTRLEWKLTKKKDVLEVRILPDAASLARSLLGRGNAVRRRPGSAIHRLIKEREREQDGEARS